MEGRASALRLFSLRLLVKERKEAKLDRASGRYGTRIAVGEESGSYLKEVKVPLSLRKKPIPKSAYGKKAQLPDFT